MNKSIGTRQDKTSVKHDPNTTMGSHNMPGYRYAFKFAMDVIAKMDLDTKRHFAEENDDVLFSYILDLGRKKGLVPNKFMEEDLAEVTGEFEEIFKDPEMEGWSWTDLIRDQIGIPVKASTKANVQAHKAQVAQQQKKINQPIDPKKLQVVDRTDTGKSEVWYPVPGAGYDRWIIVAAGFSDKKQAEQKLNQLQQDPNAVKIIQAAILKDKDQGVAEGLNEFAPDRVNGGDDSDGSKHTLTQAIKYIKKKYPIHKKYVLGGSYRYMDPIAVANWIKKDKIGNEYTDPMEAAIKYLGMVENPLMSGMDSTHKGREDWWHTYENNQAQIAVLHFVGQYQGWIIIAGNTKQNLADAVQVFRNSGILPDLIQAKQHRQDKAASRLSKLSATSLKVGDTFGTKISWPPESPHTDIKWNIWKVLEFTKTGKIKAQKVDPPWPDYPNPIGTIKLFDPKGRLITNKQGLEAGQEYKKQQGVAEAGIGWHGTQSGSDEAQMTDHTMDEAIEYLKTNYPAIKKYMVRRAEYGFRAVNNPKYFDTGDPAHLKQDVIKKSHAHMTGVDGAVDYLQLKQNKMMSGSKQVTLSIGYSWSVYENPANGIAMMYYQDRGMGQDEIYLAGKNPQIQAQARQVFRDAGILPTPKPRIKQQGMSENRYTNDDEQSDIYDRLKRTDIDLDTLASDDHDEPVSDKLKSVIQKYMYLLTPVERFVLHQLFWHGEITHFPQWSAVHRRSAKEFGTVYPQDIKRIQDQALNKILKYDDKVGGGELRSFVTYNTHGKRGTWQDYRYPPQLRGPNELLGLYNDPNEGPAQPEYDARMRELVNQWNKLGKSIRADLIANSKLDKDQQNSTKLLKYKKYMKALDYVKNNPDQNIDEGSFKYDKKTGQMKQDNSNPDQRHGLFINSRLMRTYNTKGEAENVKRRDPKFKNAVIKPIDPSNDLGEGLKDRKDNPCWKGYKPVGTKKKNGRTVPNCVPVKEDSYMKNLTKKLNSIVKK